MEENEGDEELLVKKGEIQKNIESTFTKRQKKPKPRQGRSSRGRNYNARPDQDNQEVVWGSNTEPNQAMANEEHYNDNSKGWNRGGDAGWNNHQESRGKPNRRDETGFDEHQDTRAKSGRRDGYQGRNQSSIRRGGNWRQRKNSTESNERPEAATSERSIKPKKKYYNHDDRWNNTEDQQKGRRDRGNWGTWEEEGRGGYRRGDQGRRDYNRHYSGREHGGGWDNDKEHTGREYGDRGYGGKDSFNSRVYSNRDGRREHHQERGERPQTKRSSEEVQSQGVKSKATTSKTTSAMGTSPQPAGVWNERSGTALFKKDDPLEDLLPRNTDEEEMMIRKAMEESKKSALEEQQFRSLYPAQETPQSEIVTDSKGPQHQKFGKEDYPDVLGTKVWEDKVKPVHGKQTPKYGHNENQPKEAGNNATYFSTNEGNSWGDTKWPYNSGDVWTSHSGQTDSWQQSTPVSSWAPFKEKSSFPTCLPENDKMFSGLNNMESLITPNSGSKDPLTDSSLPAINRQLETTLNELIQEQQNTKEASISFGSATQQPDLELAEVNRNFQNVKATPDFGTRGYGFEPSAAKDALNKVSAEQFPTAAINPASTMETPALHFPPSASLGSNTNLVFTSSQKSMVSTSIQPSLESLPRTQAPSFPESFQGMENSQKEACRTETEPKDSNTKSVLNEILQFIESSGQSFPKPEEEEENEEIENLQKAIRKKIEDMQISKPLMKILLGNDQEASPAKKTQEANVPSPTQPGTDNANMLNCVNQVPFPGFLVSGQPMPPYVPMMDARGQVMMVNPMLFQQHLLHSQYMQAAKTALSQEEGRSESIPMFPNPMCPPQMTPFIGIPNPAMQTSTQLDGGISVTAPESSNPAISENMQPTSIAGFQAANLPQMAALPNMAGLHLAGIPPANLGGLPPGGLQSANLGGMQPANLGGMQPANLNSLQSANLGVGQSTSFGGLQSANLSGLQSGSMPSGIQPVNMTSLQSANLTSGLHSANMPSGLQSANVLSGLQSANVPSGLQSANVPTGLQSANVSSGPQPANVSSVLQSGNPPSGLQSTNIAAGPQSVNMVPGMQSANIAAGLQSSSMIPGLASSSMVPGLQPASLAQVLQSASMSPSLQSTSMAQVLQSANMSPSLQSTSMAPSMQSTILQSTASMIPGIQSSNLASLRLASGTPPSSANGLSESHSRSVGLELAGMSHLDSIASLRNAAVSGGMSPQQSLLQERLHAAMGVEPMQSSVLHHASVLVSQPREKD